MALVRDLAVVAAAAALAAPGRAAAHISLEHGGTHLSRYGDLELKAPPCGRAGGTRGAHVYTYAPGETITLSVMETIPHPGYFRIAFQAHGDDEFRDPASILPVDPNRGCPVGPGDRCGASDFFNTPNVLLDDLAPHLAGAAGPRFTWSVTLPDVECDDCTLQVIQVMEDDLAHGPYDPTPGSGVEDVYHQCVDLVLRRGAASAGPSAGSGGGCDASGASGAAGWIAALAAGAAARIASRRRGPGSARR
jgi:hypothetical protein